MTGAGTRQAGTFAGFGATWAPATELAMQDVAMKFVEMFQGIPEVRQLVRERENQAPP